MKSENELRSEVFDLTYLMHGMDYSSILEMDARDRVYYHERLIKQLKSERDAIENSKKK